MASAPTPTIRQITGTVVTAGLMQKTVKVRIASQVWNNHIRKYFHRPRTVLVHDPRNSLVAGDVIRLSAGWRVSKTVRHVVTEIIAPFGKRIEERPAVMSVFEREAERAQWGVERKDMKEQKRVMAKETSAEGRETDIKKDVKKAGRTTKTRSRRTGEIPKS